MNFTHLYPEIQQHAIRSYPEECCGLVVGDKYYPSVNLAPEPDPAQPEKTSRLNTFKISSKAMLAARKIGLQAIVHSHPDGLDVPSAADMAAQIENVVPWILLKTDGEFASTPCVFGDSAPIPDLMKRTFRHGVTDCYSLIRDFYRQELNITLQEFPRDWDWWHHDQKLYEEGFPVAGFYKVDPAELQYGDMFLANIRSKTPNHGGVYVGDGMILHHLTGTSPVENRLPKRDLACRYQNYISYWLRHNDAA